MIISVKLLEVPKLSVWSQHWAAVWRSQVFRALSSLGGQAELTKPPHQPLSSPPVSLWASHRRIMREFSASLDQVSCACPSTRCSSQKLG